MGVETEGLGFEAFAIAAADTLSPIPTEELLARYAAGTERRGAIPGTASAFSTAKAGRMLGFVPRHGWRETSDVRRETWVNETRGVWLGVEGSG